jgi:carbon-monoxide dehydrogenase small subunit
MTAITLTVNGKTVRAEVTPRTHLADFLREDLLLTGTHIGCEHGICGACTVEINGEIARSCITYAVSCDGASVRTIESFEEDPAMAALRRAFSQHHALQCGYCTPGVLIAARDLIRRKGGLSRGEIRSEMSGNLCRCTGYMGIIDAIQHVMAEHPFEPPGTAPTAIGWLGPPPGPGAPRPAAAIPVPSRAGRPTAGAWRQPAPAPAGRAVRVSIETLAQHDGEVRLRQRFELAHAPAAVWGLVSDVARLAQCMPGLSLDGPPDGERVSGALDIKLGPITARFAGQGKVRLEPLEQRLVVVGRGVDRKGGSNVSGTLSCHVEPAPETAGASAVALDLAYSLSGPLAQIGRGGLVQDLARRLGEMFAQNMDRQLEDPSAATPAAVLAGFAVLWAVARDRLAALLGRLWPLSKRP